MSRPASAKKSKQKEEIPAVIQEPQHYSATKSESRKQSAKKSKTKDGIEDLPILESIQTIPKSSLKKKSAQKIVETEQEEQKESKVPEIDINDEDEEKLDEIEDYQYIANPSEDIVDNESEEVGELDKLLQQTKEDKIKKIQEFNEQQEKKGVIYLSRIPPYMKAAQVRNYFSKYGVLRVYLAPEEESKRKFRVKMGGNKKRRYTEGWIEFADKNMAKFVAYTYNNQQVGGKKGGFYTEDIWNIRYLSKFKWLNLTEKIQYDQRLRNERLKAELNQDKKLHDYYREQTEKSKQIMGMLKVKEKKKKHDLGESVDIKRKALEDINEVLDSENRSHSKKKLEDKSFTHSEIDKERLRRAFKQKKPKVADS